MGTGASISICQTLSSIEVKHCTNKVGPEPQRIFGIPLDNFTQDASHHHVPLVVNHMVEYLEEFGLNHKGLFRISGSATKIKELRRKYDQGEEVNLVNEGDVDSVASLLKLFLNELPVAIFPDNLCTDVLTSFEGELSHMAECMRCLRWLLSSLPKAHSSLFHYLIRFLVKVASYSDVNHMTLENLAIVFGPTLFRIPCSPSACEKQTLCNAVLLQFLQHHKELFVECPDSHFALTKEDDPQHLHTILPPQALTQQQAEELDHL
ncbi:protein FAM13A-like [Hemicordylus capensis]|uniref:protein FAM13A-like n=1 Tax=Hemicordylus capensis TaxID=884348 RepID=UPI0023020ECA|nr:protein FAM13A-like [Hemicordylus capensis]XP_053168764.1 protein FAM13A-like [Hemicordylus capensis]